MKIKILYVFLIFSLSCKSNFKANKDNFENMQGVYLSQPRISDLQDTNSICLSIVLLNSGKAFQQPIYCYDSIKNYNIKNKDHSYSEGSYKVFKDSSVKITLYGKDGDISYKYVYEGTTDYSTMKLLRYRYFSFQKDNSYFDSITQIFYFVSKVL